MDDLGELMIRRAIITFDYVMLGRWLNSGSVKDACIRMIIPRSNLPTLSLSLYIYTYATPPQTDLPIWCASVLIAVGTVWESTISRLWKLCVRARFRGFGTVTESTNDK